MNRITLVCTRSAISASALTYMINHSPDFYSVSHNNLWLAEVSDKFGTAHTINDWWNVPDSFTAYNKSIRNAETLTLEQLQTLSDCAWDINLGRDIALFTHATNPAEIEQLSEQHKLSIDVVTCRMGDNSHHFVLSWLRREYNQIMNDWENQERAWKNLMNHRTVKDSFWNSERIIEMHEWLIDPAEMYRILKIKPEPSMALWCKEYRDKNGISITTSIDDCWHETNIGNITKLQVLLYLVNKFYSEGNSVNATQLYGYKIFADHLNDGSLHYTELDNNVRNSL